MSKKGESSDFGRCFSTTVFGLNASSEDNSDSRKILKHFNGGFEVRRVRDEDYSSIQLMQDNLL